VAIAVAGFLVVGVVAYLRKPPFEEVVAYLVVLLVAVYTSVFAHYYGSKGFVKEFSSRTTIRGDELVLPEPSPEPTEEPQRELELIWAKSERGGRVFTLYNWTDLYVVGGTYTSVSNGGVFNLGTIEARDTNTGELLDHWIDSEEISYIIDCTVVDRELFAIEVYFETPTKRYYLKYLQVFDRGLNLLDTREYQLTGGYNSMGHYKWRIHLHWQMWVCTCKCLLPG